MPNAPKRSSRAYKPIRTMRSMPKGNRKMSWPRRKGALMFKTIAPRRKRSLTGGQRVHPYGGYRRS